MNRFSTKLASTLLISFLFSASAAFSAPGDIAPSAGALGGPNPKAVMMYNLGIKAYKEGSTEAAVIFFKRACDIDPNLADAQYNLAVIYQAQKRWKEAVPRFEEVLRLKPNDPDAEFQLGVILQELGRLDDARQHLTAIAPNNPHFPEAQRRLANLNNPQRPPVAQQPYGNLPPTGYQPAQPMATPDASYQQQPILQAQQQPIIGAQAQYPATQPVVEPDATAMQPPVTQPVQQATAPVAPVQAPNPVPVLANSSLRVVATGFSAPAGLSFDRNGNLYVANYLTNTIDRIAPDGTRTQFSSGSTLRGPIGLITDENGNVYVANYNGGTVAKINPAGVSTVIATGFKKPYYLTLDRDGNLYVSQQEDNSIVRITLPRTAAALNKPQ